MFDGEPNIAENLSHERMYSWYFTREELEKLSPSRKDGITQSKESEIRHLYCSFIRDVGMRLKLYVISFAAKTFFLFVPFHTRSFNFLLHYKVAVT
jgi:cyclin T